MSAATTGDNDHLTASQESMPKQPVCDDPAYKAAGKLTGKRALITGADSGIGRAVAIAFAKEGADVAIDYSENDKDAQETKKLVERYGRTCAVFKADISKEKIARKLVSDSAAALGGLDILVNNAAMQLPVEEFEKVEMDKMEKTFQTNIFSMFYLTQAALEHFTKGSVIINTTSVTAYRGSELLIDYASTKGAIVAFTRSLSKQLIAKGIRVNAVAPGPIWTPLIVATFKPDKIAKFGKDTPIGRAGQPSEVAPCYVFLASDDSSYISGQVLHPNGGEIVNA